MIQEEDLTLVGKIQKTHGINGELNFYLNIDLDELDIRFFIFNIDNIFVPFLIESFKARNSNGYVKLEGVNNESEAKELVGKDIFVLQRDLNEVEDRINDLSYFIGFSVFNQNNSPLGVISEINDKTENVLIYIQENDLIIPFQPDFLIDIDHKKKIVRMNLPDGLIDINN